jgi:hypothetical protein
MGASSTCSGRSRRVPRCCRPPAPSAVKPTARGHRTSASWSLCTGCRASRPAASSAGALRTCRTRTPASPGSGADRRRSRGEHRDSGRRTLDARHPGCSRPAVARRSRRRAWRTRRRRLARCPWRWPPRAEPRRACARVPGRRQACPRPGQSRCARRRPSRSAACRRPRAHRRPQASPRRRPSETSRCCRFRSRDRRFRR